MSNNKLACAFALTALSSVALGAQIKYVAHRGDYPDAPEGSRQAYLNAVNRQSEIVKLDLQESKDGIVLLSHDPTFKRTMGWDVKISDVTWDEIQRHVYLFKEVPSKERAVTLEDGLKIVRWIPEFWLDFKYFTPDFAERVIVICERAGIVRSQLMVATYTQAALAYMKERHPDIRRVGHIHVTPNDGKLVPSFDRSLRLEPAGKTEGYSVELLHAILGYIDRLELHGVNLGQNPQIMTKGLVSELKKRGVWVSIALIHDKETAQQNVGLGMDAVVTRDRRAVKPVLDGGNVGRGAVERIPDATKKH